MRSILVILLFISVAAPSSRGEEFAVVLDVERQPLLAATMRLVEALEFAGAPLDDETKRLLQQTAKIEKRVDCVKAIQAILDPLCIAEVNINPESRVKVKEGPVPKQLMQQGWRAFLVKVHNEAGWSIAETAASEKPPWPSTLAKELRTSGFAIPRRFYLIAGRRFRST